jgi:pyrroline-5-carboxylate reductase
VALPQSALEEMGMRLGFVGTGVITEAVIRGLCRAEHAISSILVSPRNELTAARLAESFPNLRIGASNQDVVDGSDLVFLAVRPQVAEEVVRSLRFRPGQSAVSFIPTIAPATLAEWINQPIEMTHAIPLPFLADGLGATVIYPPRERIADLFRQSGSVIEVASLEHLNLFFAASAVMGTHFGIMETIARWLEAKGIPYADARIYLEQLHAGLSRVAAAKSELSFSDLRTEFSTRGGLNEQMYQLFEEQGGGRALLDGLEAVLQRVCASGAS